MPIVSSAAAIATAFQEMREAAAYLEPTLKLEVSDLGIGSPVYPTLTASKHLT